MRGFVVSAPFFPPNATENERTTMKKTAANLKEAGADVRLCLVLANKSWDDDVDGVPLRALVRAATV